MDGGDKPPVMARRLPAIGQRIELLQPHPWHGFFGRVVAHRSFLGFPGAIVQIENAGHDYVGMLAGSHWRAADQESESHGREDAEIDAKKESAEPDAEAPHRSELPRA